MKTYHYTAKDPEGNLVKGEIETKHFAGASQSIQSRGLQLVSLEEVKKQVRKLESNVFDDNEQKEEKISNEDENSEGDHVFKDVQDDFEYQVVKVKIESDTNSPNSPRKSFSDYRQTDCNEAKVGNDTIIFDRKPRIIQQKKIIAESKLQRAHDEIQNLLVEKGAGISEKTKDQLLHLDGMIDLVEEQQNKAHWKQLTRDIRQARKQAQREIKVYEQNKWVEYARKSPVGLRNSVSEVLDDTPRKKFDPASAWKKAKKNLIKPEGKIDQALRWFDQIDHPDPNKEEEVLLKHKYEAVWIELQRFTGALMVFYFVCFFISYYLKRNGLDDSFLVRIYDTILFKQIVLELFSMFVLLGVREYFLPKTVKTDGLIIFLWLVSIVWVF